MRDVFLMRTTINIDDDVLATVKAMAKRDRKAVGQVVSAMLRKAVEPPAKAPSRTRNGIPLFPVSTNASVVTPELVKELLEDEL